MSLLSRGLGLVCWALCACGEDDTAPPGEETEQLQGSGGSEQRPASTREGPEGCYSEAERRCDCAIEQASCTQPGQIWTMGCSSCQS